MAHGVGPMVQGLGCWICDLGFLVMGLSEFSINY
jgi:hypothetical protein